MFWDTYSREQQGITLFPSCERYCFKLLHLLVSTCTNQNFIQDFHQGGGAKATIADLRGCFCTSMHTFVKGCTTGTFWIFKFILYNSVCKL